MDEIVEVGVKRVAEANAEKLNPGRSGIGSGSGRKVGQRKETTMNHKIAILSDIHGNATALEAVIVDAKNQGVSECWASGRYFSSWSAQ